MNTLSVVIACHNDNVELDATVRSIRATTANPPQVIVVDDASPRPIVHAGYTDKIIRTARRIGVGPARYLGALHASGTHLLFIDSHSRFEMNSWQALTLEAIDRSTPSTVHCGTCLGLGFNGSKEMNMDISKPNAEYHGATWNFFGPDRKHPNQMQVFESVWADKRDEDDYELSAVMGAAYVVPRQCYLSLECGRHLTSYGADEQELALKCWLAGIEVRMLKGLRVGHKFREAKRNVAMGPIPYNATTYVLQNKIHLILTLLPKRHADFLLNKLRHERGFSQAMKAVESRWPVVEIERNANTARQKMSFEEFLERFKLTCPTR